MHYLKLYLQSYHITSKRNLTKQRILCEYSPNKKPVLVILKHWKVSRILCQMIYSEQHCDLYVKQAPQ